MKKPNPYDLSQKPKVKKHKTSFYKGRTTNPYNTHRNNEKIT